MAGVVHIPWYATVLRRGSFGGAGPGMAPLSLRYGATKYQVQRNLDDRYKILHMMWFENKADWYRFWESPELIEFRSRYSGHFQIPIVYQWHEELASGELGPSVENGNGTNGHAPEPTPE